jgi:hypothetical protein
MNEIAFTFGIITNAQDEVSEHLLKSIQSIRELHIPEYEIIIIGTKENLLKHEYLNDNNPNVKFIDFNETQRSKWITKKKNLITKNAKFDNIVYQHDYIYYNKDWYEGFKMFGDNFDICMNKILNENGERFRDWVMFPYHCCYPMSNSYSQRAKKLWEYAGIENNESMIPYDENRFIKYQYVSGSYWVAKKYVMEQFPLDESLVWGEGEDCIWSMQTLDKCNYVMNQNSTIHFNKWKQDAFGLIRPECLKKCIEYIESK